MNSSERQAKRNPSHLPWEMVVAPRWMVGDRGGMPLDVAVLVARLAMAPEEVAFELGEDPSVEGVWGVIEVRNGSSLDLPGGVNPWKDPTFYRELASGKNETAPAWRLYVLSSEPLSVEGYRGQGVVRPAFGMPRLGTRLVDLRKWGV
jgi:hypothetical protein